MKQPDDRLLLQHMHEHAVEAISLIEGCTHSEFVQDRLLQLALVRLIEVVGEAASRISEQMRQLHPDIPWKKAVRMRNRLIHGYDSIDLDIVWNTLQEDLPPLTEQIRLLLNSL